MLYVLQVVLLKQELVMQLTRITIEALVTPELGLVPEDLLTIPLRVEMQQIIPQIMVTDTSKLWDIFWCSKLFQSIYYVRKLTKNGEREVGDLKEPFSIYLSLPLLPTCSACKFIFFRYAASAKTRRDLNKDFTRMGSFCITI